MKLTLTEQQLHRQVRYFGYYQLASGLLLLGLILVTAAGLGQQVGYYLACLAAAGLAGFIVYCGYLTLRRPRQGLLLSRYHLAAQLLSFAGGGFAFQLFAGPSLALGLTLTDDFSLTANASLGSSFQLSFGPGDETFAYVNLMALLLFLLTTKWLNEWRYPATAGQQP